MYSHLTGVVLHENARDADRVFYESQLFIILLNMRMVYAVYS